MPAVVEETGRCTGCPGATSGAGPPWYLPSDQLGITSGPVGGGMAKRRSGAGSGPAWACGEHGPGALDPQTSTAPNPRQSAATGQRQPGRRGWILRGVIRWMKAKPAGRPGSPALGMGFQRAAVRDWETDGGNRSSGCPRDSSRTGGAPAEGPAGRLGAALAGNQAENPYRWPGCRGLVWISSNHDIRLQVPPGWWNLGDRAAAVPIAPAAQRDHSKAAAGAERR